MHNNTSGQGKDADIPSEIEGWNWGAFLLTWIWGIGNNTYRAFWVGVPLVNIIMVIALGIKGNEWAWRHRKWESIEHFKRVQRRWAKAGFIFLGIILLLAFGGILSIMSILKDSEPYKLSVSMVSASEEFADLVGEPYETGFVTGSIQTSGHQGVANLFYEIEGPKGNAEVALKAEKDMNTWQIIRLHVKYSSSNETQILASP